MSKLTWLQNNHPRIFLTNSILWVIYNSCQINEDDASVNWEDVVDGKFVLLDRSFLLNELVTPTMLSITIVMALVTKLLNGPLLNLQRAHVTFNLD